MIAWILILLPWGALLALIVHDATKKDAAGAVDKTMSALQDSSPVPNSIGRDTPDATDRAPPSPAKSRWWRKQPHVPSEEVGAAVFKTVSASQDSSPVPNSVGRDTPAAAEQALPSPAKNRWWRKQSRARSQEVSPQELELAILDSVKAEPGCEGFVGVFVRPKKQKSRLDSNWELRGVKYGNVDRELVNQHLATIVARLQHELRLSDDHAQVS